MIGCWCLVVGVWLFCCLVVLLFSCLVVCLEDSTTLLCSFALRLSAHALKKVTDNTDATDFIFHRFNNIMRYHLILDLLRIAFAPIRRGITASKR